MGSTTRSTLRRWASCRTSAMTGNAPPAPVPITSRRHRRGDAGIAYQLRRAHAPRDPLLCRPAAQVGTLDAKQCPRCWSVHRCHPAGVVREVVASDDPLTDAGQAERIL
jgi:hypothetical protein